MNGIDVETLLHPVSPGLPCGQLLEAERIQLETAMRPKPDPKDPRSEKYLDPDWTAVKTMAAALLAQSKDLYAVMPFLKAMIKTEQWLGLRQGLALLRGMLERYWASLHPQLVGDDLLERINLLQPLSDYTVDGQDLSDSRDMMLYDIRRLPLVKAAGVGEFSSRDIQIVLGKWPYGFGAQAQQPDKGKIDAAFSACDATALQDVTLQIRQALEHVAAIDALLVEFIGNDDLDRPTFQQLTRELQTAHGFLMERLAQRGLTVTEPKTTAVDEASNKPLATHSSVVAAVAPAVAGTAEIRSRDDVLRALDRLCEYYQQHEPSSPVPLLLERAKQLVSKSFIEILQDLAPSSLEQISQLRGAQREEESG